MFYFYALLLIISGVAIAWFGQKKYGLSFAVTYFVTSLVSYLMIYSETGSKKWKSLSKKPFFSIFLGITVAITLGIWFFSKTFTYLIAWEIIALVMMFIGIKLTGGEPSAILSLVVLILPIAIVYYFRKIITKITLGFFSGFNIAFGLLSIILIEKIKSGEIFSEQPSYMLIILLVCLIGGVYFQFSPFANIEPEKENA